MSVTVIPINKGVFLFLEGMNTEMKKSIEKTVLENIELQKSLLLNNEFIESISRVVRLIFQVLESQGKIVICGNGGSASDSQHFAAELIGRFKSERDPLPAMCINSDVATMTAIANDYGYDNVFLRQTEGILMQNDILIGLSTSGESSNVYNAILEAKRKGIKTVAFLGKSGGRIKSIADEYILIPSYNTARIQECHLTCIHIICNLLEEFKHVN